MPCICLIHAASAGVHGRRRSGAVDGALRRGGRPVQACSEVVRAEHIVEAKPGAF